MRSLVFTLLLLSVSSVIAEVRLSNVRSWDSPEKLRLVFEASGSPNYSLLQLNSPDRVVLDFNKVTLTTSIKALSENSIIRTTRHSTNQQKLRLVLELTGSMPVKHFVLKPNQNYGYRLVVDLYKHRKSTTSINEKKFFSSGNQYQPKKTAIHIPQRDLIIAIDAGHGGEDPGAIGKRKVKEKTVVFAIAKKLATIVNQHPGMRALLIREGDYYVSLRARTQKARNAHADVFISIHADAFKERSARGSSVFILSEKGASSATARWLAHRENSADLAGGVSLDDKDDLLVKVLLDLSQTATIEGSVNVAGLVLNGLKKIGKTHNSKVERAGFAVLKSPDIPSILVETGFISNPYEEKLLNTSSYQYKIAKAIFRGIDNYFKEYPVIGTVYGQKLIKKSPVKQSAINNYRYHTVKKGESLSKIAQRYDSSIATIKNLNRLKSSQIMIGQKLRIPN